MTSPLLTLCCGQVPSPPPPTEICMCRFCRCTAVARTPAWQWQLQQMCSMWRRGSCCGVLGIQRCTLRRDGARDAQWDRLSLRDVETDSPSMNASCHRARIWMRHVTFKYNMSLTRRLNAPRHWLSLHEESATVCAWKLARSWKGFFSYRFSNLKRIWIQLIAAHSIIESRLNLLYVEKNCGPRKSLKGNQGGGPPAVEQKQYKSSKLHVSKWSKYHEPSDLNITNSAQPNRPRVSQNSFTCSNNS